MPSSSSTPATTTDPTTTTNKDVEMGDLESSSKKKGDDIGSESANRNIVGTSEVASGSKLHDEDEDTRELRNTEGVIAMGLTRDMDNVDDDNAVMSTGGVSNSAEPSSSSSANPNAITNTTTADNIASTNSTSTPIPQQQPQQSTSTDQGPICTITLLLTSGARHPYKLDSKYLTKRNVNVPGTTEAGAKDPFSISVYTLKELILREWREEWEGRPSSPSSIRLIHFGRLLDDKMALRECRFNIDSPNVVHMTVRPQEVVDEEDASKGKVTGRDGVGSERTAGCRCVIM